MLETVNDKTKVSIARTYYPPSLKWENDKSGRFKKAEITSGKLYGFIRFQLEDTK